MATKSKYSEISLKSIPEGLPAPGEPLAQTYTKEGFVPDDPKNYAVMMVEAVNFDDRTGERLSSPHSVTFNANEWRQWLKFHHSTSKDVVEILHLPKGWVMPEINII